jgi:hypothetical protein
MKQDSNIDESLKSTVKMLQLSFPNGVSEDMYLPLLRLLYDELSDRNLAESVAIAFGGKSKSILNDVYKCANVELDSPVIKKVKEMLVENGYDDWLNEDEVGEQ